MALLVVVDDEKGLKKKKGYKEGEQGHQDLYPTSYDGPREREQFP